MRNYEGIEELLEQLNFDDKREERYGDDDRLRRFLREFDRDERRELKRYIEDYYDTSDDSYIEMKNSYNKKHYGLSGGDQTSA